MIFAYLRQDRDERLAQLWLGVFMARPDDQSFSYNNVEILYIFNETLDVFY